MPGVMPMQRILPAGAADIGAERGIGAAGTGLIPVFRREVAFDIGVALCCRFRLRLAELLAEVVRRGTVCGWAKSKSSAWRKFGGEVG